MLSDIEIQKRFKLEIDMNVTQIGTLDFKRRGISYGDSIAGSKIEVHIVDKKTSAVIISLNIEEITDDEELFDLILKEIKYYLSKQ